MRGKPIQGDCCSCVVSTRTVTEWTRRETRNERRAHIRRTVGWLVVGVMLTTFAAWDSAGGPVQALVQGLQAVGMLSIVWFCAWLLADWRAWKQLEPADRAAIRRVRRRQLREERRPGDPF